MGFNDSHNAGLTVQMTVDVLCIMTNECNPLDEMPCGKAFALTTSTLSVHASVVCDPEASNMLRSHYP